MSMREALSRTLLLAKDTDLIGRNMPTDEHLLETFRATKVLVVADEANLGSVAGQHALVALFCLVARIGVSLRLAVPEVPVVGFQPPVHGPLLREGLLDLGRDMIPECEATLTDAAEPADVVFILGSAPWHGRGGVALRLSGDEWKGLTVPASAQVAPWTGSFPIGPLTAASIAAPEAFKAALRKVCQTSKFPVESDFLTPVTSAAIRTAPATTGTGPFALGKVDVVSGGAISNAVVFTLLRLPGVTGAIRVIEPKHHDLSNLNRYPLLRRSQVELPKVEALLKWESQDLTITGVPIAFHQDSRAGILPFAPHVLVGADDIPTRWEVQQERPAWLGVGATSHGLTVTSSHTWDQSCAGCLHPYDDAAPARIPTVSFVSFWAGLLLATRLLRHLDGQALFGREQSIVSSPFRLDQVRAYWPVPVPPNPRCPVRCPASRCAHVS